jgi:hypothetical protein
LCARSGSTGEQRAARAEEHDPIGRRVERPEDPPIASHGRPSAPRAVPKTGT